MRPAPRLLALLLLLVATSMLAVACGGPEDADKQLAAACDRQQEEIAVEETGTPTAKSTEDALDDVTLIECSGQHTKIVPAEEGDGETPPPGAPGNDEEIDSDTADGEATTPVKLDDGARDLFSETCGGCHTLGDAGTTGAVGPDLDETTLDATQVAEQIETGGGAMPAQLLTGEDATAVAEYVAAAAAQAQAKK